MCRYTEEACLYARNKLKLTSGGIDQTISNTEIRLIMNNPQCVGIILQPFFLFYKFLAIKIILRRIE